MMADVDKRKHVDAMDRAEDAAWSSMGHEYVKAARDRRRQSRPVSLGLDTPPDLDAEESRFRREMAMRKTAGMHPEARALALKSSTDLQRDGFAKRRVTR